MMMAISLAWAIRGQHGHERGAAYVGAMAGLAAAAVTGSERWVWAGVWASFGFAVGGAVSYGEFVGRMLGGSVAGFAGVLATGVFWGAMGCGALAWGLRQHRPLERCLVAALLVAVWGVMDWPLSAALGQPGLRARAVLVAVFGGLCASLLWYYAGIRKDRLIRRLALAGAIGWGVGFPAASACLVYGPRTGWVLDWWKAMELAIGLSGGAWLGFAVVGSPHAADEPLRAWQRWAAAGWLLLGLPSWLWANNVRYWSVERGVMAPSTGVAIWLGWLVVLGVYGILGISAVPSGSRFSRVWTPEMLRRLCVAFIWIGTLTAIAKTSLPISWSPTQSMLASLALGLTLMLRRPA